MRLLLLAVLLVLPAFFAAAEVALLRLRPSRVEVLVEEEQAGARSIQRLQRRLRRALLVSQLGATLALVALGWAGRGLGGRLWSDGSVGVAWRDTALFLCIVLLATLVAGLLPKAWVLNRPESSALRLAPLLEVVMRCLAPLLNLLEALAGLALISRAMLTHVEADAVAVAGLTLGADPLVSGVAMAAADQGRALDALIVRKEAKGHGTGAWLEGPLPTPGALITVLEDVVTTGGSSLKAVRQLREAGYKVNRVITIVDREEGGDAAMTADNLELISLYKLSEIAAVEQA